MVRLNPMTVDRRFFGERLRLARNFRGWTQSELGELVHVSRQFIYKIERGDAPPSEDLAPALAQALGFPLDFFHGAVGREVREEDCHFRKRVTTPQFVRLQATAHGTLFCEAVDLLDLLVRLPKLDFPECPEASTAEQVERAAEASRRHWSLGLDRPIHSVVRVLENAGAVVATFDATSNKLDAFSWPGRRHVVVRSSLKSPVTRARFDFAHEAGHLVLHQGASLEEHEAESQANLFASAFLLPRSGFIPDFPRSRRLNWNALFKLKQHWGVSVQAIVRRAYDLRLLDALQYRTAYIHIARQGWKTKEPHEPECVEKPELFDVAAEHLREKHGVEPRHIAAELSWPTDVFETITGVPTPRGSEDEPRPELLRRKRPSRNKG